MKRIFSLINKNILSDSIPEKNRSKSGSKNIPIITISREMGSGGRPIANEVVKVLGKPWKLFHREIIEALAKESKLEKKLIEEVDENRIPLIDELIADFFGKRYLNLSNYYRNLAKILSTVGHRGYVIIMGRGASYLFPEALNVRIICEMNQRIKWMMSYEKLSKTQAINRINESDRKRLDFEEALYSHDPRKAHHYDLVIRTSAHLGIKTAAGLIVLAAKKRFYL